jgi:hypothetical protein
MNKLIYLVSIVFLMLQACSSSNSNSNNTASSTQLVGKWEVFQVGTVPPGTVITGSESLTNFQFACSTYKDYYLFGGQGTFKVATYNNNCSEGGGIGTYTKTDNIINLYQNNVLQVTMEILSLSSSTLKVKYPSPATGTPNTIVIMSFKKI